MDSEPVGMVFNWSANFHLSGACCAKVSLGLRAAIHTITKIKEKEKSLIEINQTSVGCWDGGEAQGIEAGLLTGGPRLPTSGLNEGERLAHSQRWWPAAKTPPPKSAGERTLRLPPPRMIS